MTMYFFYHGKQRPDFFEFPSTFAAIVEGKRTSTLRKKSWYMKQLKVYDAISKLQTGDYIRFWEGNRVGQGSSVLVKLIHPVVELNRDLTMDELERLSKVEGWSVDYLVQHGYGQPRNVLNLRFSLVKENRSSSDDK